MPDGKNAQVAEFLENISDLLEIKGDSPFRVRAYRDAGRAIESLQEDIEDVEKRGALTEIPGVGESIAAKITEYIETGGSAYYDELKKQVKPGLAELLRMEGYRVTPFAVLSRGVAGIRKGSLIVNLPGSPKAVKEGMGILGPVLPHALQMLAGVDLEHDH